jgi:hypothetical protein
MNYQKLKEIIDNAERYQKKKMADRVETYIAWYEGKFKNRTAKEIPYKVNLTYQLAKTIRVSIYSENPSFQVKIGQSVEDNSLRRQTTRLLEEGLKQVPEAKVNIMWTFLTINFFNETSPIRGLETLVNENFYSLFTEFPENKTFLIPHNRLFLTKGLKQNGNILPGIRSIPDALLIVL